MNRVRETVDCYFVMTVVWAREGHITYYDLVGSGIYRSFSTFELAAVNPHSKSTIAIL